MNDVCLFSRYHVVECSERAVLSCLEPVYVGDVSGDTSPIHHLEKYLSKRRQHKQTGSRQDKTVLSEHSTT